MYETYLTTYKTYGGETKTIKINTQQHDKNKIAQKFIELSKISYGDQGYHAPKEILNIEAETHMYRISI